MNDQVKEGCLNCGKDIAQKKGKRKRLYCSDLCRATFHQKKKIPVNEGLTIQLPKDYINTEKIMVLKEDGTMVPIEDFPKTENNDLWMQAFGALKQVVDDSGKQMFFEYTPNSEDLVTPVSSAVAGKTVTVTLKAENMNTAYRPSPDFERETIEARIKVLEKELKNPPKTAIIGVKNWIMTRQIELSKLKEKLNPTN